VSTTGLGYVAFCVREFWGFYSLLQLVGGPMVFDGVDREAIVIAVVTLHVLRQSLPVGIPYHGGGYGSRSPPQ
jgi:hypothetical protein